MKWALLCLLVLLLGSASADEGDDSDEERGDPPDVEPALVDELPYEDDVSEPDENEVEALGRMLRSEAASHTDEERLAIGWHARTYAARHETTIYALGNRGGWGPQGVSGRPWSTRLPARQRDLDTARTVLLQPLSDAPPASNSFFEPAQQDLCFRNAERYRAGGGRPKFHGDASDKTPQGTAPEYFRFRFYFLDADAIRAKWGVLVRTVGRWEFYR